MGFGKSLGGAIGKSLGGAIGKNIVSGAIKSGNIKTPNVSSILSGKVPDIPDTSSIINSIQAPEVPDVSSLIENATSKVK